MIFDLEEKGPSPKHIVSFLIQRLASDQPEVLSPCWKDYCSSFFMKCLLLSVCQQQRALPLLSCSFFLLALITRELLFHSDPYHREGSLLLSALLEIEWSGMCLPRRAPSGLPGGSAAAPGCERRRPRWRSSAPSSPFWQEVLKLSQERSLILKVAPQILATDQANILRNTFMSNQNLSCHFLFFIFLTSLVHGKMTT